MRLIVTRPAEDGERTASALIQLGHQAILSPLLEVRIIPGPPIDTDGVGAILITSANGVRAIAAREITRALPLYAVGPQSAEAARQAGFAHVHSAGGDAAALVALIRQTRKPDAGALLHAAGHDTRGELAGQLTQSGFTVRVETLYEAVAAKELAPQAVAAIEAETVDGVLLYSPRSAQIFAALMRQHGLTARGLSAHCISVATAAELDGMALAGVRIAERPDQEGMLALLA